MDGSDGKPLDNAYGLGTYLTYELQYGKNADTQATDIIVREDVERTIDGKPLEPFHSEQPLIDGKAGDFVGNVNRDSFGPGILKGTQTIIVSGIIGGERTDFFKRENEITVNPKTNTIRIVEITKP